MNYTIALVILFSVSHFHSKNDIIFVDCPRAGILTKGNEVRLYQLSSKGKASHIADLPIFDSLPELAWDSRSGAFVCSSAKLKETWLIRPDSDGNLIAERSNRFVLPSKETIDGRCKASWTDVSSVSDARWDIRLKLQGATHEFRLQDFSAASKNRPATGEILWSGWSPSGRYFALSLVGKNPGRVRGGEPESLCYLIDSLSSKIRYLGHGFRGCWISENVFSRTSYDYDERQNDDVFGRTSTVEDIALGRVQSIFPNVEILSGSSTSDSVLVMAPKAKKHGIDCLCLLKITKKSALRYLVDLHYRVGSSQGASNYLAAEK